MTKDRKSRCGLLRPSCSILGLLSLFICLYTLRINEVHYGSYQQKYTQEKRLFNFQRNSLFLISKGTLQLWREREFLVIFGMPSLDIPKRRWRRHMQRATCWQFPEVATRQNNYTGAMLVLYLLARQPVNNFTLSDALIEEAAQWQDIVIHPMNGRRVFKRKIVNGKGDSGVEDEIESSRKTFFWFQFSLLWFPRVPYFAKGDDDIFISVPQYLADLRRLPRKSIYWGRYAFKDTDINEKGDKLRVRYMLGFCYTLARDAVESFVSYRPIKRLMSLKYNNKTEPAFTAMNMKYEDVMVGQVLKEVGFPVIYVTEGCVRFHIFSHLPLTEVFVATHSPEEHEYYQFMNYFRTRKEKLNCTEIVENESILYFMHPSL